MKKSIKDLLYTPKNFSEVAFFTAEGNLSPGDEYPATQSNSIPGKNTQYIKVSRIGQAVAPSPNFVLGGYDANGCAYGTLTAYGEEWKWKTDGKTIWTTLAVEDAVMSDEEICRLFLFPLVVWYEPRDKHTKNFRATYQQGKATKDDCLRFCLAFHYGYVDTHPESEVIGSCSESQCLPSMIADIIMPKARTETNGLPWQINPEIPNDLSVASAILGKYNVHGKWGNSGVIIEGDEAYDFSKDMVPADNLNEYIDNPDFRDVLQQVIGYISSLFRTNNMKWDGKTPINQMLNKFAMQRSNQQNIMLAGEPGSGKTLLCRMIAAALGIPCAVIRLNARSEKDELTQEIIATTKGFSSLKSQLYWYVKYGGIVLFDDLSNADANMFFSITGGLFESPYEYTVNQTKVRRHPLCLFFATTNVGTIGSQPMNEASLTRFGGHFNVQKLEEKTFCDILASRAQTNSGTTSESIDNIAKWTFTVFTNVSRAIKTVDPETAEQLITLRAAISTAEKVLNALAEGFPVDGKKFATQTMANILYAGGNPALQKAVYEAIDSAPSLRM